MNGHKTLSERTGLAVFFADPQSLRQRGSNENTDGFLRQYLPKGTHLSILSQIRFEEIAWKLNTRPSEHHGFRAPFEVYNEMLIQAEPLPCGT